MRGLYPFWKIERQKKDCFEELRVEVPPPPPPEKEQEEVQRGVVVINVFGDGS